MPSSRTTDDFDFDFAIVEQRFQHDLFAQPWRPVGRKDPKRRSRAYNPINLPRISFMNPEHGTEGHPGSSEGTDSPQMSLFEGEGDD